ncbi:hypothetical protein BTVI_101770 [Pitangus sulphuratus]|nr:hypothetical protein BTVI_101770 [Pitangus sulphuratus]
MMRHWNSLPGEIVAASSLEVLKARAILLRIQQEQIQIHLLFLVTLRIMVPGGVAWHTCGILYHEMKTLVYNLLPPPGLCNPLNTATLDANHEVSLGHGEMYGFD